MRAFAYFIRKYAFILYLLYASFSFPVYLITSYYQETITGTLIHTNYKPYKVTYKSKTRYEYFGLFNFADYNDKVVEISEFNFKTALPGEKFDFIRSHVYRDHTYGFFTLFASFYISTFIVLTLFLSYSFFKSIKRYIKIKKLSFKRVL